MVDEQALDIGLSEEDFIDITRLINSADWDYSAKHKEEEGYDGTKKTPLYRRQELFTAEEGDLTVKLFRTYYISSHDKDPFVPYPDDADVFYEVEMHRPGRIVCQNGDYAMSIFRGVNMIHKSKEMQGSLELIDGGKA